MRREFLIEEIFFDDVCGEVGGVVMLDRHTEQIEQVECETFRFWSDSTGEATFLSAGQRALAMDLVERVLAADSELGAESSRYVGSANAFVPSRESTQVLAKYLRDAASSDRSGSRRVI